MTLLPSRQQDTAVVKQSPHQWIQLIFRADWTERVRLLRILCDMGRHIFYGSIRQSH